MQAMLLVPSQPTEEPWANQEPASCCHRRPSLLADLRAGVEAARGDAVEKQRIGDPRQSYEVAAKVRQSCLCVSAGGPCLLGGRGVVACMDGIAALQLQMHPAS